MNIGHTICLAAAIVLSQSSYAQGCSGGADGGMDATGNQCGDAATVGAYAKVSDIASLPPDKSVVHTQGKKRVAKAMPFQRTRAKTSKTVDASPCSGGPDDGMDITGNQCSKYAVAGTNAGKVVVAKH